MKHSPEKERHDSEVAIIGMAGRFPRAGDIETFWQNLRSGIDAVTFFAEEDLRVAGVEESLLKNPNYVRARMVLEGSDLFDAAMFGYTPREAELMDPQHRVFLECARSAIEHAGYVAERYRGLIGVFAGAGFPHYFINNVLTNRDVVELMGTLQATIGNESDSLASRVAYKLNLKGPSIGIQTFCSTSLVAVHLACQSLLSYECDMAMAGGVAIDSLQNTGYLYQVGGIASPDGHCRAFDAKAQGSIYGSGAGVVVLKRLEDAIADGDSIYAVIKGSATNNDGSLRAGYTAPGLEGQSAVVAEALSAAGVDSESISYIETHGTATPLGDSIELAALMKAFAGSSKKQFCAIGSVKPNIGHLDRAAGVASLIKAAQALRHKELPPSLYFEEPNPDVSFNSSPFYVNTTLTPWEAKGGPRRAGVSAFGLGGTNAHVVLEEWEEEPSGSSRPAQLLILSAKTESALTTATERLAAHFKNNPCLSLPDAAFTLQVGRSAFNHRRIVVCRSVDEAIRDLETANPGRVLTAYQEKRNRPLVFLLPGVGEQYVNMAAGLYAHEPVFRADVEHCCALLQPELGLDLREVLFADGQPKPDLQTLFRGGQTSDDASARLSQTGDGAAGDVCRGVRAGAAAHELGRGAAGADRVQRGRVCRGDAGGHAAPGGRAAAGGGAGAADRGAAGWRDAGGAGGGDGGGEPAARDGAGGRAVDRRVQWAAADGGGGARGRDGAAGSGAAGAGDRQPAAADHACLPFADDAAGLCRGCRAAADGGPAGAADSLYLEPDGDVDSRGPGAGSRYWARHMCETVRFGDGISELLRGGDKVLVEVGPGQGLGSVVKQHPAFARQADSAVVSTLKTVYASEDDEDVLLGALGRLWLAGTDIDWDRYYADERRHRIPLPTYPFERQRFWLEPGRQPSRPEKEQACSGRRPDIGDWFYTSEWREKPLEPSRDAASANDPSAQWLVFVDGCGIGHQLVDQLKADGRNVVTVKAGTEFSKTGAREYVINPAEPADYRTVIKRVKDSGPPLEHIVHLWTLTGEPEPTLNQSQRSGFYSLLFLAKALGDNRVTGTLTIDVVSDHLQAVDAGEDVCAAKATLLGPCRVIPQEYPNVTTRSIDIRVPAAGAATHALVTDLFHEVTSAGADVTISYRENRRLVQSFAPTRLEPGVAGETVLRHGGVYLITGGLGGVGLVLAEFLARQCAAKVALTTRQAFPAKEAWGDWLAAHDEANAVSATIRKLQRMEEQGGEVLVARADAGDESQMRDVVAQIQARFGALHGVLHAAGLTSERSHQVIQEITADQCEAHFLPKIHGTRVLERLLQGSDVDFCLLFSSLSATLGGITLSAYSAANAFLESFAVTKRHETGPRWVAVNWDTWKVGTAVEGEKYKGLETTLADFIMWPAEGAEAFQRVLGSGRAHLVNSTGDLGTRLDQWIYRTHLRDKQLLKKKSGGGASHYARPSLSTTYVPVDTETEERVARVFEDVLGIDKVGLHDNYFELGGNSLVALQVVAELQKAFEVPLSPIAIFEYPTVSELARHLSPAGVSPDAQLARPLTTGTAPRPRRAVRYRDHRDGRPFSGRRHRAGLLAEPRERRGIADLLQRRGPATERRRSPHAAQPELCEGARDSRRHRSVRRQLFRLQSPRGRVDGPAAPPAAGDRRSHARTRRLRLLPV